jgi:hypothetical protein
MPVVGERMADDVDGIKQRVAESVTAAALSRLTTIIGVPAVLAVLIWAASELNALGKETAATNRSVEFQQRQIDGHEIRINRLEQRYFTPGN